MARKKKTTEWGNTEEELDKLMRQALLKVVARRVGQGDEEGTQQALVLLFEGRPGVQDAQALAADLMEQAK